MIVKPEVAWWDKGNSGTSPVATNAVSSCLICLSEFRLFMTTKQTAIIYVKIENYMQGYLIIYTASHRTCQGMQTLRKRRGKCQYGARNSPQGP